MSNTWMDGGALVHTPPGGTVMQVFAPDVANQVTVSFTASSDSSVLPSDTRVFRLHADQACFITFGTGSATATTSHMPFDAGTEVIAVPEPYNYIAAIRNSSDGTLTVTPMG